MILEEMLSNELLRQAAEKCAEAIIASLPAPEECNHKFSKRFEKKDAGTTPTKDILYHESRVYIQIARTAVISGSSLFYYSNVQILLIAIIPIKWYTLIS